VSEEPATAEARSIAREILCYLEKHPEAKDTVEGIAQWWLRREDSERSRRDVERAVALLCSQGLILETRRQGVPPYYQRNLQQRTAIAKILKRRSFMSKQISDVHRRQFLTRALGVSGGTLLATGVAHLVSGQVQAAESALDLAARKGGGRVTRNWTYVTDEMKIVCYPSEIDKQISAVFAEVDELSPFHDTLLAQATSAINATLDNVRGHNQTNRDLSVLILPTTPGLFLAWTENIGIGPDDDVSTIEHALGLRREHK